KESNNSESKFTLLSTQVSYEDTIQNVCLIWLDKNIGEENDIDCMNIVAQLQQIINDIRTFTDVDECVAFINDITDKKSV
ncbi:unnamed protein product, partial [Adineta steineri]